MPRRVRRSKVYRRAVAAARRAGKPLGKPLVKLIKSVAAKSAQSLMETKYVADSFSNLNFNSIISSGTEQYSCYPKMGQGTNTWERIGLDVNPVRCRNTWVVSLAPVQRTINVWVDLFVMIDKQQRYYPNIAGGAAPSFLRSGGSAGNGIQQYSGVNVDSFRKINAERYTLLKHFRFQLCSNVGYASGDVNIGNAPNVANQSTKTLSYVVDTPKVLRYLPNTASNPDYPSGHAPFWVLGYSKVDGTVPDLLFQGITVSHITEMMYKDA